MLADKVLANIAADEKSDVKQFPYMLIVTIVMYLIKMWLERNKTAIGTQEYAKEMNFLQRWRDQFLLNQFLRKEGVKDKRDYLEYVRKVVAEASPLDILREVQQ